MLVNMGRIFQQTALRSCRYPAVINVEQSRHSSSPDARTDQRTGHVLKQRYGLRQGNFSATILDDDDVALSSPLGSLKESRSGAVRIDVRDSVGEQTSRIDHVAPKLSS